MKALHQIIIKNEASPEHSKQSIAHLKDYYTVKKQKHQSNHTHIGKGKFNSVKKYHDKDRKGIVYVVGELKDKYKNLNGYGLNEDIERSMNTTKESVKKAFNSTTPTTTPTTNNNKEMIEQLKQVHKIIGGSAFGDFLSGLSNTVGSIAEPLSMVAPEIGIPLTIGAKAVGGITNLLGLGNGEKKKRGRPKKIK